MFCGNCGTKLKDEARFCPECGTPVEVTVKEPEAAVNIPEEAARTSEEAISTQEAAVSESASAEEKSKAEEKKEKKAKGNGGKTAFIVILLVVLAGAIGGIVFYLSPGQQYNRAMKKGDALMQESTYSEAVDAYLTAYDIENSREVRKALAKAYLGWGDACVASGSFEEALSYYNSVLEYQDDNEDVQEGFGLAYLGMGKQKAEAGEYEEAMNLLDEAELYPVDYTEVNNARATCYVELGKQASNAEDYDKALEYFDRVLYEVDSTDSTNSAAYAGKARVLAKQGEVRAALDLIEEGVSVCGSLTELTDERDYIVENSVMIRKITGDTFVEEYNDAGVCIHEYHYNWMGGIDSESLYDDEGKKLRDIGYDMDGSVYYEYTYEYDDNGNEVAYHAVYSREGLEQEDYVYEYDNSGNMTKKTVTDVYERTTQITIYEYDTEGNCTKEVWYIYYYDGEGATEPYFTFMDCRTSLYDEYGNVTAMDEWRTEYDGNSEETFTLSSNTYEYEYDDKGNILKSTQNTIQYNYIFTLVEEYQYNADGVVVWRRSTQDVFNEDDNSHEINRTESTYNEKGLLLESIYNYERTGSEDYSSSTESYQTYDEYDNTLTEEYVLVIDGDTTVTTYEYENIYDEFGNLTRRENLTTDYATEYSYEYKLVD